MLIIIEGVDRTGKSTLADMLKTVTGGKLIHNGKPEMDPREEYLSLVEDYTPGNGEHLIFDRFHIGERVWPKIFDRESDFDRHDFIDVDTVLHQLGALIVYAERDDHDVWAKELEEHNEPIDGHSGAEAKELFEIELAKCRTPVQRYNFADFTRQLNFLEGILFRAAYEENRVCKERHA